MSEPKVNTIRNHSEFCTKNVAIGLMLGIVAKNPIPENLRPVYSIDDEHKRYLDRTSDLDDLYDTEVSIYEIIKDFREAAQFEKDEAIEDNDQIKKEACKQRILDAESKLERAYQYSYQIDMELKNIEYSQLIRNEFKYKKTGETLISIFSLDQWAKDKYNISILNNSSIQIDDSNSPIHQSETHTTGNSSTKINTHSTKLDNMHVTIAYFLEEFSQKATVYKHGGKPNAIQIASYFSKVAKATNNYNESTAFSEDNLRKLFSEALKCKAKRGLLPSYIDGKLVPLQKPVEVHKILTNDE